MAQQDFPYHPLENRTHLDPLLEQIGDARFVLLGEASHGTSEYYTWRSAISKRLIEEKGFSFIAVEGDWPACYSLNRFVKGYPDAGDSVREVLQGFDRWPTWMWGNWEVAALADWLREYNSTRQSDQKIGFFGLDVYSLWESLESIITYLEQNDGVAVGAARNAFRCFEPYYEDPQAYARATAFVPQDCENAVLEMLHKIQQNAPSFSADHESNFNAEQNALVAVNAEKYYRAMIRGGGSSWNVRDRHMMQTLNRLMEFHGPQAKAIVWEHNTHVGDARATDMARNGMVNVGQLVREEHGRENVSIVGFGSYEGSVIAGDEWGAPMEVMTVPKAASGSWERRLHQMGAENKLIFSKDLRHLPAFEKKIGHRAIGVVYHPEMERYGNYVPSLLPERYDAFLYIDQSMALHPLGTKAEANPPDLYPWYY
ncbi:N/A [soil metagenome]|jgi:erythromycin esterase-like protein